MKTRNPFLVLVLLATGLGAHADAVYTPSNESAPTAGYVASPPGAPMDGDPMQLDIAVHGDWRSGWAVGVGGVMPFDIRTVQISLGHWDAARQTATTIDAATVPVGKDRPFYVTFRIPPSATRTADLRLRLHGAGESVTLDRNLLVRLGRAAATGRPDAVETLASAAELTRGLREQHAREQALAAQAKIAVDDADAVTAGSTTIRGTFTFTNPNGIQVPLTYVTMEVWDRDEGGSTDDRLLTDAGAAATAYTDVKGNFEIKLRNYSDEDGSKADVYFVVIASTNKHKVLDMNGLRYVYTTAVFDWDLAWDTTVTMNRNLPLTTNYSKAFWINRNMGLGWRYFNELVSPPYTAIANMVSRFPADGYSTCGTAMDNNTALFSTCNGEMYFGSSMSAESDLVHELGHLVMFRLRGNNMPSYRNCSPHHFTEASDVGCAWMEGWAHFVSCMVRNTRDFTTWFGASFNLETFSTGDTDDEVEGRVAAMLWDLQDTQNDGRDQNIAYSTAAPDGHRAIKDIIDTMYDRRPANLLDFVRIWGGDAVSQRGINAVKVAMQNTITGYYFPDWPDMAMYNGEVNVPNSMTGNTTASVQIKMVNIGGTTWTRSSMYRLGSVGDSLTWGIGRVEIPGGGIILPGETASFAFTIRAPQYGGSYPFQWRMVKEGVHWFGENTPAKSIIVYGPNPVD